MGLNERNLNSDESVCSVSYEKIDIIYYLLEVSLSFLFYVGLWYYRRYKGKCKRNWKVFNMDFLKIGISILFVDIVLFKEGYSEDKSVGIVFTNYITYWVLSIPISLSMLYLFLKFINWVHRKYIDCDGGFVDSVRYSGRYNYDVLDQKKVYWWFNQLFVWLLINVIVFYITVAVHIFIFAVSNYNLLSLLESGIDNLELECKIKKFIFIVVLRGKLNIIQIAILDKFTKYNEKENTLLNYSLNMNDDIQIRYNSNNSLDIGGVTPQLPP